MNSGYMRIRTKILLELHVEEREVGPKMFSRKSEIKVERTVMNDEEKCLKPH